MNGVNKWKDELAAMTRERNRLNDLHESQKRVNAVLREELAINREALARLTERIRELEAAPKFDINTIFGGVVNGKP